MNSHDLLCWYQWTVLLISANPYKISKYFVGICKHNSFLTAAWDLVKTHYADLHIASPFQFHDFFLDPPCPLLNTVMNFVCTPFLKPMHTIQSNFVGIKGNRCRLESYNVISGLFVEFWPFWTFYFYILYNTVMNIM